MSYRSLRSAKLVASIGAEVSNLAKPSTPKKASKSKDVVKDELESDAVVSTKRASKKSATASDDHELSEEEDKKDKTKVKAAAKRKYTKDENAELAPKKRKTKEEKEAETVPIAPRTAMSSLKMAMYVGAHVSGAGGVQNSITNAQYVGGNSFALFLKSQRKWVSPPLAADARDQFHAFCKEHNYDTSKILPHGSYLVNLAQNDPEKAEQAYSCFLDDLKRCEALGIQLYNFHPGNTGSNPRPDAIKRISDQLNKAHKSTKTVITVLENMAGTGNVIGSTFQDIRDIIALVQDKSRVGVCIDTCHTFAAGYDLRSPGAFKKTMDEFSSIVGMSYLKALHLNDSKTPLSSHRDIHANIGTGFLGLRAFHNVMNYAAFEGIPMVLETPIDKKGPDGKSVEDKGIWATEIKLLESLIGADVESDEFRKEEKRLQEVGKEEREKFQKQVDKKTQKSIKDMFKAKGKGKKTDEDNGDENEDGCSH